MTNNNQRGEQDLVSAVRIDLFLVTVVMPGLICWNSCSLVAGCLDRRDLAIVNSVWAFSGLKFYIVVWVMQLWRFGVPYCVCLQGRNLVSWERTSVNQGEDEGSRFSCTTHQIHGVRGPHSQSVSATSSFSSQPNMPQFFMLRHVICLTKWSLIIIVLTGNVSAQ